MGTQAASINWEELLADLQPKPGDYGDCFSTVELSEAWGTHQVKALRVIDRAIAAGILKPVKIPVVDHFGDTQHRKRYRLIRKAVKRKR